jgi:hypothetical protein
VSRLCLVLLLLGGCVPPPALYVDQVEGGCALLVEAQTNRVVRLPATALGDAGEGSWLGTPDQESLRATAARRARLGQGDDGRDLQLGQ